MDEKTLKALKGSIRKWESIANGTGEDKGWRNCPLCVMFNNPEEQDHVECIGCPVAAAASTTGCEGTPYYEWADTFSVLEVKIANTPERQKFAQQELDFLRSLLPADATALTSAERTP